MTTSAAKTCNCSSRGFSLLEIVIVLAISSLIVGGAVGMMILSSSERALRNASGEIEVLAKRARTIAALKQIPYALEFRPGIVRLRSFAQAGSDPRKINPDQTPGGGAVDESREFVLDDGMNVFIRHWNSEAWLPVNQNATQVWRFDPDGLCEPISVRLTLGDSWAEDTYHPLTATIRDSQLEAR